MEEKKDRIFDYEQQFAYRLAASVLDKPRMNIWMILIPIILVFHIYRHQRYVDGKKTFAENYLVTRKRALAEAFASASEGRPPRIDSIVEKAGISPESRPAYGEWVSELVEHYADLLGARGQSLEQMIRAVFRNRTNYQLFLRRLGEKERRFHAALKPSIEEDTPEAGLVISRMESGAEALRKEHAAAVFS
jgi:hypothetical protein